MPEAIVTLKKGQGRLKVTGHDAAASDIRSPWISPARERRCIARQESEPPFFGFLFEKDRRVLFFASCVCSFCNSVFCFQSDPVDRLLQKDIAKGMGNCYNAHVPLAGMNDILGFISRDDLRTEPI